MMDFDPLIPIPGVDPAAVPEGGMVARLRYQQTKIDGAPETILVGANVVQIIREQQAWVRERWKLGPDETVRYLFPKLAGNRKGTRAWTTSYYDQTWHEFQRVVPFRPGDTPRHAIMSLPLDHPHIKHVSAAMSLRYGRLFDATVRDEYQRALTLAKAQLGPVLPGERTQLPVADITGGNWRDAPLHQSPPRRRVLPARRRPGPVRLRQHLRALPELPHRRQLPARPATAARRHRSPRRRRRRPRLGRRSRPPPPPPRTARPAHQPGRCQLTTHLTAVEAVCAELTAAGQPVTFAEVAARAQISRTTLYRRADLRAVIDEHSTRGHDATTLTSLTVQIDQMRRSLEAVAAKVRRHEETIRRLERARRTGQ